MKRKFNHFYLSLLGGVLLTLGACSKNDDDTYVPPTIPENWGLYVLNEGNFGSTNSSIGLYNFANRTYETVFSNIGDTGNDIGRYGNKLYVVVNGGSNAASGKLLVYNIANSQKIGEIPFEAPRYIKFYKGKAYVTHGENGISQLDTGATSSSLPAIAKTIGIGRTPEQLTIFKDKIYVANSGALSQSGYDNRVSVINVGSFALDRNIEVADNITSINADTVNNTLYVNAAAIYNSQGITSQSKLYAVNTSTDTKTPFTFGAEQMFIIGKAAVLISSNKIQGRYNILYTNDIQSQQFTDNAIVNQEIKQPYGITFVTDADLGVIAIGDADDYKANGKMFLYNGNFQLIEKITAGIIPKKVAFKN
jgi:hypothetical protein